MKTFVATLLLVVMAGGLGSFFVPVTRSVYWGAVLLVAGVLGALRASGRLRARLAPGAAAGSAFLCDTCKYDHPGTCSHPERPNANRCSDYRRRGG